MKRPWRVNLQSQDGTFVRWANYSSKARAEAIVRQINADPWYQQRGRKAELVPPKEPTA